MCREFPGGSCGNLVVRSTKVSAASISASKDLQLVVRAGEGVDKIDLAAAAIAKVEVVNRGVPMPMPWLSLRWGLSSAESVDKSYCIDWCACGLYCIMDRSYLFYHINWCMCVCVCVCVCACVCPEHTHT